MTPLSYAMVRPSLATWPGLTPGRSVRNHARTRLPDHRANERPAYYMAVDTRPNVVLTCDPTPFTATMIATAISGGDEAAFNATPGTFLDEPEN